jgi:hypothetical protein
VTDRPTLARRLAELLDDDELLRRAIAFLEAGKTGSLQMHVHQGRVLVLDELETYRKPGRSAVR